MRRRWDCSEKEGGLYIVRWMGGLYIVRRRGNCSEKEGDCI